MERVASEFANYFAIQNDFTVSILMFGNNIGTNYNLDSRIKIYTPNYSFENKSRLMATFKALKFIKNKTAFYNPDFILSFGELWNSFVLLALLGTKYPVFISDRCQPDKSLGFLHDFLRKYLYPFSKGYIVQTKFAKDFFSKIIKHKNIFILANPVTLFNNEVQTQKENIILSVGRLIPSKNFDILITIFSKLNAPNWKLVIVGDNTNDPQAIKSLKSLVIRLGLNDRVELVGHQNDVATYYSKSKLFAFTSTSEGFPNVLIEAMGFGLPVISYDCTSGPSDIINHGVNGYLVENFQNDTYIHLLQNLIQNEELRNEMSNAARKRVLDFEIGKIGLSLKNFLLHNEQ